MSEKEIWKPIEGFENYSISSFGRIRNNETGKLRKLCKNRDGYLFVTVPYPVGHPKRNKYSRKWLSVSLEMAKAFIPNPDNLPTVDHINRVRDDNRIENLRWSDWTGQLKNRSWVGYHPSKEVEMWTYDRSKCLATYESSCEAERITGINHTTILKVCEGAQNRKSAGGYWWRFADVDRDIS